jgi:cobalt-zinc-cadmium efflux system protein
MHHHHDHHGHHHHHGSSCSHGQTAKHRIRTIGIVVILNLVFAAIEVIGSRITGSVAILSNAIHDLGDGASLAIALLLEIAATQKSSLTYSYGMRRLSLLSSLILALGLVIGSGMVLWTAIPRLFQPTQPETSGMVVLAVLGICANGLGAWLLARGETLNQRVISWHLVEDLLGWVVTLVAAVVMMFGDFAIIDPIISILFTLFILIGVLRSLRAIIRLFLQGAPQNVVLKDFLNAVKSVAGVVDTHDSHLWSLDGEMHVLTLHVVIRSHSTFDDATRIKQEIKALAQKSGKIHTTIEIEQEDEACPDENCVAET